MTNTCRICGKTGEHATWELREKMFGLGDAFTYFQCLDCGCLQIISVPADWSRYYPPTYYSFTANPVPQNGLRSRLAGWRDRAYAVGRPRWWKWLGKTKTCLPYVSGLGRVPLNRRMRILDVGCGRGQLLSALHRAGFYHLSGVDPFLSGDHEVLPGLWVRKQSIESVPGSFDLIMLHHVLEHVERQLETLTSCRKRLAPGGKILVRIPTIDCLVTEHYRDNAVQLDPPRHLFLHSRISLDLLVRQAGLKTELCWCDSTEFQFWASELYKLGLPLTDKTGQQTDPARHFTAEQMKAFAQEATRLNAEDRGNQVAAILTPDP
jgi:SAM-dependent methyltransferase